MPPALTILCICLLLPTLAAGLYHAIVWARIRAANVWIPTLRDALTIEDPTTPAGTSALPPLTVIVPAHNERDVIARVARTLLDQDYPKLRIVFALDRCTDDTEEILRTTIADDPRAHILTIDHCPEDFAGKVHAMHAAYTHAFPDHQLRHHTGPLEDDPTIAHPADDNFNPLAPSELVLFADADTFYEQGALRAAAKLLDRRELALLSLLPTLTADEPWERFAQPAAGFELIQQFPLDRVNDPAKARAFANGQFMLFRRSVYERMGGHVPFRTELLEDLSIARFIIKPKIGGTLGCVLADGLVRCQMYRSPEAFKKGWKRIFTEAARRRPARLRQHAARLLLTSIAMPAACLITLATAIPLAILYPTAGLPVLLIAAALLALAQTFLAISTVYRQQHLPRTLALTYPLAALRTARILLDAARDLDSGVATTWAGKHYARKTRP